LGGKAVRLVSRILAALILLPASLLLPAGLAAASAEDFRTAAISVVRVDWRAALDQLRGEINIAPAVATNFIFSSWRRLPRFDPRSTPALLQLNAETSPVFTGIGRSPVPVLLPLDTAAYVSAQLLNDDAAALSASRYLSEFHTDFFDAGPAGYDAVFSLPPESGTGLPQRSFAKPVEVQITGSLLTYDVADPAGGKGEPVKSLAAQYPDLRRFIREGYVRYAFTRFGVPYVVSIQCLDSVARARRLACREAYPVAERFLKALRIAGGFPARPRADIASTIVERPLASALDFTYRAAGDIIVNSGARGQGGRADLTAYSQIRFPLQAPAFIHSQSFGRRRSSDKSGQPSSQYPWRDNFCEARSFGVGQCASGFGHQGEDIRPGACTAQKQAASGCNPRQQPIVAVRDGIIIRSPKQQAATLQINTQSEHVRFRYMHMNPSAMDADALLNERHVAEGEKIGVVSNYLDHPNGTTRHLHFDVQVFTRDGWIWVNPYVTLISAYERLLHGRGHEIGPEIAGSPDIAHAAPEEVLRTNQREGSEN
jgi:murein DD-endopeptidase MepM/ murein hydrolase activator NlpD